MTQPLWLAILGMVVVTYGIRLSFLVFGHKLAFPPALQRALRYVPAAVLTALIVPMALAPQGDIDLGRPTPTCRVRWWQGRWRFTAGRRCRPSYWGLSPTACGAGCFELAARQYARRLRASQRAVSAADASCVRPTFRAACRAIPPR